MAVRVESQAEPIPGYRLLERLGGGGFGEVWKAEAPGGLHKAIKFVFGDLRTAADADEHGVGVRAEQELKALSRVRTVRHPYILSLERFDIIEGQLIIVMELADKNLWDRFRECRSQGLPGIPREELLRYMEETAEALDLMNGEHQLQHLDIKPQNLFLVHSHVKVADFGLVKDLEGMVASVTGGVTPVYAAPETFDGWVSRFCDQYSLAIVYQELLTGQRPFSGTNVRQLVMQHLQGAPNLASLPPADRTFIARALSKSPDERFPTCTEFVRTLRTAGTVPDTATLQELGLEKKPSQEAGADVRATRPRSTDETDPTTTSVQQRSALASPGSSTPSAPWSAAPLASPGVTPLPAPPSSVPLDIDADGVLLPSVVIGLGGLGLEVLQRFRGLVLRQFGTGDSVPHLRLLHVDTDPDARSSPNQHLAEETLSPGEQILARLNRPSHYLRSQENRARLSAWMDVQMLYRIPRTPATTGVRALGRLAFIDNYKGLSRRVQEELEAILDPDALHAASQRTGLALRANRPRVYLVTSLAGGTGGGMFLDMAYLVRAQLLKLGYTAPDVVGVLFLPPVSRHGPRGLGLANTFAALTELYHFSAPGTTFSARYVDKEPPLLDTGPPFSRCVLLPLPEAHETKPTQELLGLTADFLTRDLLTPLGRLADQCRARLGAFSSGQGLTCQSFGLYRLSWPRQALLHRMARRVCRRLAERWATKDAEPLRAAVAERAAAEWTNLGLAAESVIDHLQRACEKALGEPPESAFSAISGPLITAASKANEVDSSVFSEALARLEKIVSRHDADTLTRPPVLIEALTQGSAELVTRWCLQLETLSTELIELPDYRLAGAEEALRQLSASVQKTLEHYEPLGVELATRVVEARTRIEALLTTLQGNRKNLPVAASLIELLRQYPKWRYQSLVLQQLSATYVSLRGRLSDQLREINFCRARLHDLKTSLQDPPESDGRPDSRPGREFFPAESRDLEEATAHFFADLKAEDWREIDEAMQDLLLREFGGLVQICLAPANCLPRLEAALLQRAEELAAESLAGFDVAEMFLDRHKEEEAVKEQIVAAFDEAAPEFATARLSRQPEICILAAPATPAGARFRELANSALPDVAPVWAACGDDILFYREVPNLLVANLEQLGAQGLESYRQLISVAHFTPHNRRDITEWQPVAAAG